ncbi:cation:proton antiporter [Nocardioides gilvus]|uniref:cation:proton antiporter n=1 Tax=Nocardioides gilvus TaxID=1735589 RepID=UPI000D744681|nr:cation:proton antiporter [Nocardioides gilvus]
MESTFQSTAAVLAVAAAVGMIANRVRQPLIVAFIAVGVLVGPSVLGWVEESEPLELFAEMGIAVLLFLVGLKLDLHLVRTTGRVALITGLGQVVFTSVVGYGLALALGMDPVTALYVAIALTFSSTIIIVKLLSDKRELDELHGRIALGFLIVQDIVVVLLMIVLSSFGGEHEGSAGVQIMLVVAQGVCLVVGLAILMRWVLPRLMGFVAGSQELLVVFAVAWATSVAALGDWMGFSIEVGAFLAGFALASTRYRESLASSLTGLRDFLLLFFFIELGSQFDFAEIGSQIPAALVLSVFVLVGNPLIVLVLMGLMGYPKRVSFLAGLAVAQISEFSLILVALGLSLGHIENDAVGLVTLVGIITIGTSTYLILYSHQIYERLAPFLRPFERRRPLDPTQHCDEPVDVIVYGYGRYGHHIVRRLADEGMRVLVVDWDPYARLDLPTEEAAARVHLVFGDADDPEFPASLPLSSTPWVVSTIPRVTTNRILATALRRWQFAGRFAVTAHTNAEAASFTRELDSGHVDLVLHPFHAAAEQAARALNSEG